MLCPYHYLHGQSRDTLHYPARPGWVWLCRLQPTKLVSTKIDFSNPRNNICPLKINGIGSNENPFPHILIKKFVATSNKTARGI
jgi:hypothetical protein